MEGNSLASSRLGVAIVSKVSLLWKPINTLIFSLALFTLVSMPQHLDFLTDFLKNGEPRTARTGLISIFGCQHPT